MSACGVARMGYRNADEVSYWWLNSYIDIEPEQSTMVRRSLNKLFDWQHKTQHKDYVKFLTQQQSRLQQNVTKNDLLLVNTEIRQRLQVLADHALPDLADLALSLQAHQIAKLEKKFASNNNTFRKENLSDDIEKRQRFRFKKALQQAEYWFGNFNREQEAQIRAASDARPMNNELLMVDRLQRQRDLLSALRKIQAQKPPREAVIAMLKDYLNNSFYERPGLKPEIKAFLEQNKEGNAQLAAVIINLATPEQKARAIKNAQQWIEDFTEMANAAE
ncbi:hypothetical protein BH11PSE11_BH11PSE11_14160 [soil metagenome]